jgi:YfiR/HmsC-like
MAAVRCCRLRLRFIQGAVVSVLACGGAHAQTPIAPSADAHASAVAQVVLGIISYTTWPKPHSQLRLCILAQSNDVEGQLLNDVRIGTVSIVAKSMSIDDLHVGLDCDVVYANELTGAGREALGAAILNRPILTIDEGDATCSSIIMFCLNTSGTTVTFSVNLDSVARSGVEVNPQVLLLGRRRTNPS